MNRKISAITAACIAVVSTVACGDTWSEKEEKIDNLTSAAYKIIDNDFIGIISNDPNYCLNDCSEEYRSRIMEKYDVDMEWLIVADKGDIKVYYSEDWGSPSYVAGESGNSGNPSLAEMYDDGRKMIEKSEKEAENANIQTTTQKQTTVQTTTTTTAAKPSSTPNKASSELGPVSLRTGGKEFTVASWNPADVPALLEQWEVNTGYSADKVEFINFDCGGGFASEKYDEMFAAGDDLDVYFCEADWALKYINDERRTAPLEALGFSDANFANAYDYTMEIGRATSGANAGKIVGASWQAAAGGFAYRTDLAEQYLGVMSPDEMQAKIQGWDNFVAAASEIAASSRGKVALADSVGGMWQAFSANRVQPWVIDNQLVIDDSCRVFADYAKTLWENGGVTHNGQWSDTWIPAGQDGACMGYFVSAWGFGERAFFGQASSGSYGKWAVCEGPSPYFWGGTWIVVNPATDNAEEAQSFIFNAAVDYDAMKKFALSKPEYVNNMAVMQEIIDTKEVPNEWVINDLGGQNYFEVLHENARKIDLNGLITPYDATIKSWFLSDLIDFYLIDGDSWNDTVSAFKNDVKYAIPYLS